MTKLVVCSFEFIVIKKLEAVRFFPAFLVSLAFLVFCLAYLACPTFNQIKDIPLDALFY